MLSSRSDAFKWPSSFITRHEPLEQATLRIRLLREDRKTLVCTGCIPVDDFYAESIKNENLIMDFRDDVTAVEVEYGQDAVIPAVQEIRVWKSCCFLVDKQFAHFLVQTLVGLGLLCFCSAQLVREDDCETTAPYWGLIGTLCGFFFRKVTVPPKK